MEDTGLLDAAKSWRERKRRETRERIVDAGLKLFLKRGYDTTTMEAIAEAADVSRRSLFHYFPAKEDILFANQEAFLARIVDEIRKRPEEETWPVLVEHAIAHAIVDATSPENIAIDALTRRTPVVQSRYQLKYMHLERAIASALAERGDGSHAAQRRADLLAAVVVAGFRLAVSAPGNANPEVSCDAPYSVSQRFRDFWRSLHDFGEEGLALYAHRKPAVTRARSAPIKKSGRQR